MYDVLYNKDLIKSAIAQVLYRSERVNENINLSIGEFLHYYISRNLKYIIFYYILIIYIHIFVFIIKDRFTVINKLDKIVKNSIPFLLIALMPIVWYIVLANHTTLHFMFTNRHMTIFLLGILLSINNVFILKNK